MNAIETYIHNDLFNFEYLNGNVKKIYEWSYDRFGNATIHRHFEFQNNLLVSHTLIRNNNKVVRQVFWENDRIIQISTVDSKYGNSCTNFLYDNRNQLLYEKQERIKDKYLTKGIKYEYKVFGKNVLLDSVYSFCQLPTDEISKPEIIKKYEYDKNGVLVKVERKLHGRDPRFYTADLKYVTEFIHDINTGLITAISGYSDKQGGNTTQYFKEVNGRKYYQQDNSIKREINQYLPTGFVYSKSYEIDDKENWTREYFRDILTRVRVIEYDN